MRFATFITQERERFGIVISHPATGEDWVFDPEASEAALQRYAAMPTSPYVASLPHFSAVRPWPQGLADFLSLGEGGMTAARRLQDFLLRFLEDADQGLLVGAGYPVREVRLRAPIPRPRLYYGLVQNSPTFWRNDPKRTLLNVFPQGHARPQGTVVGPGEPVWIPPETGSFGWNPEPGFIIGRGGKEISVEHALEHVAGMTVILDLTSRGYHRRFNALPVTPTDWFAEATASWLGKMTDTCCPMGSYLTTLDEVGSIYNLQVITRQSGWLRDRSHTNSMLIGVERLIHWLSSFMTLYPGDVLHMGTMGVDGLPDAPHLGFGPDDYLEGEIERVGVMRTTVVHGDGQDWRSDDDPGKTFHPVPSVRDLLDTSAAVIHSPEDWRAESARHFWTVYGNYRDAEELEGLSSSPFPRILNGPNSSLDTDAAPLQLPRRARDMAVGPELAFVVKRIAKNVPEEDADAYILGYVAMVSLLDSSFREPLRQPATPQEWNMPGVYGRWGDGYNRISATPVAMDADAARGRRMHVAVDGVGEVVGNTDEYLLLAPRVLAFVTAQITLFPGDVITLGRVASQLNLEADAKLRSGCTLSGSIEGIGTVHCSIVDNRQLSITGR